MSDSKPTEDNKSEKTASDTAAAKKPATSRKSTASAAGSSKSGTAKKPSAPRKTAASKAKPAAPAKTGATGTAARPSKKTEAAAQAEAGVHKAESLKTGATGPSYTNAEGQSKPDQDTAPRSSASTGQEEELFKDLKDRDWSAVFKRAIFMVLFGVLGWFSMVLGLTLAVIHFFVAILLGGREPSLSRVIAGLGRYVSDVLGYLSYRQEELPFPFGKPFPLPQDADD